jgi:hypothetical protein
MPAKAGRLDPVVTCSFIYELLANMRFSPVNPSYSLAMPDSKMGKNKTLTIKLPSCIEV